MSRGTFYKWKPRFEAAGYAGLQEFESRAAHHPRMKAEAIATRVVELRRAHPDWGKTRISHEMAKEHGWVPTVSPNAVRRILKAAGLWPESGVGKKVSLTAKARSADLPGQAVNIDLCYVPVTHIPATKLLAVSGSSGHLVVEQVSEVDVEPPIWPGQIFADETLEYTAAMAQYVAATHDRLVRQPERREIQVAEPRPWRRNQALQAERYAVRERRKQEDLDWRSAKEHWRQTRAERQLLAKSEFAAARGAWIERRSARRASVQQRQAEDQVWHAQVTQLRGAEQATTPQCEWIAVLIITDNCTRQCLGLPASSLERI